MDPAVQRLLTDKLYDKRKQGALELERLVRTASANKEYEKIRKVVDQLCHEYAYAVHQPHARNGGLIGLAAASIALGSDEVARYLQDIVPPVLACFTDQDARVRYYACEAMYNIAKVAKGEILLFFNEIFDSLCKLAADSELSVKNGAELLDRLVKDIVSESAATYVSILHFNEKISQDEEPSRPNSIDLPTAFDLAKFIPLLEERIHVINPFTRTFLVSWLTLLDTIPDLELIYYLPAFLGGLFKFLSDPNRDVYVATQGLLERFLNEIKKIAQIKRGIAESRRSRASRTSRRRRTSGSRTGSADGDAGAESGPNDSAVEDSDAGSVEEDFSQHDDPDGDWIPGQDVQVDHARILDILLKFVDVSSIKDIDHGLRIEGLSKQKEEDISIVALRWIDSFFEVSPEDILQFVPRLLSQVLPAMSAQSDQVRTTAARVNRSLMDYIVTFQDEVGPDAMSVPQPSMTSIPQAALTMSRSSEPGERRQSGALVRSSLSEEQQLSSTTDGQLELTRTQEQVTPRSSANPSPQPDLDYAAAVNALTLQFLNEHEETRVAALSWLIMLHRKAPRKLLAFNDGTFPALLKTLSDPAETVVTRDLQLLSQISKNSDDDYFTSFMVALLQLFSTDRRLLEIRGNLIIRQLCINLQPERIYRTLADCLEKDEDIEFSSIMVQNLNNNLITAPELAELRKRLRNLESSKDGQMFFVALFKAWCYNAVATFSLCLLAQAYEQAYHLLQIFADLEMTVNMLIQIDKLVQLLESPVFTYLRLQLLEPDRYPYLYKCLYGLLMLLPQSSAFGALKNRLNSVSAIGLLHTPASMPLSSRPSVVSGLPTPSLPSNQVSSNVTGRLSRRTGDSGSISVGGGGAAGDVKWPELMEKFRTTQERARRRNERILRAGMGADLADEDDLDDNERSKKMNDGTLQVPRAGAGSKGGAKGKIGNNSGIGGGNLAGGLLRARNGPGLGAGGITTASGSTSLLYNRPPSAQSGNLVKAGSGLTINPSSIGQGPGPAVSSGSAAGDKSTFGYGHRSKHSLTGNIGRFASGLTRGGSGGGGSGGSTGGANAGANTPTATSGVNAGTATGGGGGSSTGSGAGREKDTKGTGKR